MKRELQEYYKTSAKSFQYSGLDRIARNKIHKLMESPFNKSNFFNTVLELGALYGNHESFVKHSYDLYVKTDLLFPKEVKNISKNKKIITKYQDATSLKDFEDESVDRLISTCLIVHLNNTESALQEWKRVVKPGGYLSVWVQIEPSLFLRIVQKLISSKKDLKFYKTNFDEHVTYYSRVNFYINNIFKDCVIKKRYFPFRFLSWNFNGTCLYTIKKSK